MKKIIGAVLLGIAAAIVGAVLAGQYRVHAAECDQLEGDLKVFAACYPSVGCMSSYTEVIDLNRRMEVCTIASPLR